MPSTVFCSSEGDTQPILPDGTCRNDDKGSSCQDAVLGVVAKAVPCLLEVAVAVRALVSEDNKASHPALLEENLKRVVILSGFNSCEAALEAANTIAQCCTRWGHSRGLHSQPPAEVTDKAISTDEAQLTTPSPSHSQHDQETTSSNGRWSSSASSINTSGAAWSHESTAASTTGCSTGPRRSINLHRDSFDLTSLQPKRPKSGRANSKLWSLIGRVSDDKDKSDASGDEIDLSRWSALSEARETALLNREPKSISKRTSRLSLSGFSKVEEKAKKLIPKNITYLGHCQNRSHTPPKNRRESEQPHGSTVPGQTEPFIRGLPSPRPVSCNDSAVRCNAGKPSLLEILETATNTRDAPSLGI